MSVATSSGITQGRKEAVKERDNSQCIICGMSNVQVAHVIGRNSTWAYEMGLMKSIAPALANFDKRDSKNLICLCPSHHVAYDLGQIVLLPGPDIRRDMIAFEIQDFDRRQKIANEQHSIVPRELPFLCTPNIECVPIISQIHQIWVHHPNLYDDDRYHFDNQNGGLGLIQIPHISAFALLYESTRFFIPTRFRSPVVDSADADMRMLLSLYERVPTLPYDAMQVGTGTKIDIGGQIQRALPSLGSYKYNVGYASSGRYGGYGQEMNRDETVTLHSQPPEHPPMDSDESPLASPPGDMVC